MFEENSWLRELRLSRSDPPGLAGKDPERRAVYNASLEQFEELLIAAAGIGVAAKPLPMFYALSQAGRAIAAARTAGDGYVIHGHGLRESGKKGKESRELMHSFVERAKLKDDADAFGVVSRAIGSADFDGQIEFGALWSATPDLFRIPEDSWKPDWRNSLEVDQNHERPSAGLVAWISSWAGNPGVDFESIRDAYPALRHNGVKFISALQELDGIDGPDPGTWRILIEWTGDDVQLETLFPQVGLEGGRRLIPILPGQSAPLEPLMLIWLLAFSLSIFARYNPGQWGRALAVNSSTRAVPVAAIMDQMLAAMPLLVWDAILRPMPVSELDGDG